MQLTDALLFGSVLFVQLSEARTRLLQLVLLLFDLLVVVDEELLQLFVRLFVLALHALMCILLRLFQMLEIAFQCDSSMIETLQFLVGSMQWPEFGAQRRNLVGKVFLRCFVVGDALFRGVQIFAHLARRLLVALKHFEVDLEVFIARSQLLAIRVDIAQCFRPARGGKYLVKLLFEFLSFGKRPVGVFLMTENHVLENRSRNTHQLRNHLLHVGTFMTQRNLAAALLVVHTNRTVNRLKFCLCAFLSELHR
mmetsp:Transcript_2778/g.5229  ORF Transcript_2778/g.5229 Transcript_2778/m.5229 type:complete len:252 (+) Transcript_2778:289-1044(+)